MFLEEIFSMPRSERTLAEQEIFRFVRGGEKKAVARDMHIDILRKDGEE